jgi:hypothetical protein
MEREEENFKDRLLKRVTTHQVPLPIRQVPIRQQIKPVVDSYNKLVPEERKTAMIGVTIEARNTLYYIKKKTSSKTYSDTIQLIGRLFRSIEREYCGEEVKK